MFRKRTFRERLWEILPGLQFWSVFIGAIALSYYRPVWAATFIVCFDFYWVMKALNVSIHLINSYRIFQSFVKIDWMGFVRRLDNFKSFQEFLNTQAEHAEKRSLQRYFKNEIVRIEQLVAGGKQSADFRNFYHLIVIPFYDESFEILDSTFSALVSTHYPSEQLLLVLASEERAGASAQVVAQKIKNKYKDHFKSFFITAHPDGLEGEIKGKSANASYAVQTVMPELTNLGIAVDQVIVSNFDSDTIVHPHYFARVMYEFLTAEKPYQCSYQPIAVYNNNIWDSPAFIRVVSVSNSFWQFTESSRPDRLRTFSSHSMTLKALVEIGFWKKDIINEDGFIYWQCYLHYKGDYKVVPLFIPISLDTCLADTFWETLKNQYKQKRRWAYNVEYYPHLIYRLLTSEAPLFDRLYKLYQYVEGNFNWATASVLISLLGWLPLIIGGPAFLESVTAYNLPYLTQFLMITATFFLVFSVYINLILLPPRPKKYGVGRSVMMYLQWVLVPYVSVIFGSVPAIEAQTRLMFGWYLEFWVTPKTRKGVVTGLDMKEMKATTVGER